MKSPSSLTPPQLLQDYRVHRGAFVDPGVFDLEMQRIFGHTWVYLGHESEIAQPGSYKATTLGTQPVLLTRDADGAVHAFINACRHRGVLLADDHTQAQYRQLVCR
jgi:phenylpropionate dioxygenase-like ring-hydroxylating dioxygenase large terminal subunit